MLPPEGADLLDEIASSLEANPQQVWEIHISATGVQISAPTTISPTIVGGGIGVNIAPTINVGDIQQQAAQVSKDMEEKTRQAVGLLREIATELRAPAPDRKSILTKSMAFSGSILSHALKAAVNAIVALALADPQGV